MAPPVSRRRHARLARPYHPVAAKPTSSTATPRRAWRMNLTNVLYLALGLVLLTLLLLGLYTRRFCQRCDYCGRFYWWIGWTAFEWTSPECDYWAMRCKPCQWLAQQLQAVSDD